MKDRGFTLIEILVAIAIIGVIFGIIISSAAGIQRAGRNAQRKTDLRTMQAALQQYYADKQSFPPAPLGTSIEDGTKKYLKTVPSDPQSGSYCYKPLTKHTGGVDCSATPATCQYYILCAKAETPASDLNTDCSVCGADSYFGVTPL